MSDSDVGLSLLDSMVLREAVRGVTTGGGVKLRERHW